MQAPEPNQDLPPDQRAALVQLLNHGQLRAVTEQCAKLIDSHSASFALWNIYGVANKGLGKLEQARACFQNTVTLRPSSAEAHNNLGVTLQALGQNGKAIAAYQQALEIKPDYAEAFNNLGVSLHALGQTNDAIMSYKQALDIRADYAEAHNNLGLAYADGDAMDQAIDAFTTALSCKPNYPMALNNLGAALQKIGDHVQAADAFAKALQLAPNYPQAHFNLGLTYKEQGDLPRAIASYQAAITAQPVYAQANNNLGIALLEYGETRKAIGAYQKALALQPDYIDALVNLGIALQADTNLAEAAAAFEKVLDLSPQHSVALSQRLHLRQRLCDFSVSADGLETLGVTGDKVATFPMLLAEDHPERQLKRAETFATQSFGRIAESLPDRPKTKPEKLRIGIFSADYHNHAAMILMSGVFREYDRSRFEIFAYSYGKNKEGDLRTQSMRRVDKFHDVAGWADQDIIDLARSDNLHIAIDRNGYTAHTRCGLFAHRLAPVQIGWLGYPGTLGAKFMDYIIADPVVIPADQRGYYTEKLIRLPDSYQPNDDQRVIADKPSERSDFGLTEDAFVFCCFNNVAKIGAPEFEIWMQLLGKIKGSELWLMSANSQAETNLREAATEQGIDPRRLIFAQKLPHDQHLARHKHADLFVDTFNYNAHTTASDALWAELPVLTLAGQQFSARVAASLLHAVGLPELVTVTKADYAARAADLAAQPEKLKALKHRLQANRLSKPLFDTKRFSRNFETGLQQAYEGFLRGDPPKDIEVTDADDRTHDLNDMPTSDRTGAP